MNRIILIVVGLVVLVGVAGYAGWSVFGDDDAERDEVAEVTRVTTSTSTQAEAATPVPTATASAPSTVPAATPTEQVATSTALSPSPTPTTPPLRLQSIDRPEECTSSPDGQHGPGEIVGIGNDRIVINMEHTVPTTYDFESGGWLNLVTNLYIKLESLNDVLVRVKQLDGDGTGAADDGVATYVLEADLANDLSESYADGAGWWLWSQQISVHATGCYGMQFDAAGLATEVVVQITRGPIS